MTVVSSLFISYSHIDMTPTNWLERLKLYLAPLRREERLDTWDDTRIKVGSQWRVEIRKAMELASAAVLLVGPGFLASEFIHDNELPILLSAAQIRGVKIYPLIVGFCAYKCSVLEPYQAFNDLEKPLEILTVAEQNKTLNEVCLLVDKDIRLSRSENSTSQSTQADIRPAIQMIKRNLDDTWTAFVAQCRRRNKLEATIRDRLHIKEMLEYEDFFFRYFPNLNYEEKFQFDQIRAITDGPLYAGNRQILETIENNPKIMDELPEMMNLRQHLVFWLNKYDRVFVKRPEMCLLYTGVEDGVPFPDDIGEIIENWLATHK